MGSEGSAVSSIGAFFARRSAALAERWKSARMFMSWLRIAWVSLVSLLVGVLVLIVAAQGQDLFLDVRGSYVIGVGFWTWFYLNFVLFWVIPIYFSSRWIMAHVANPVVLTSEDGERAQRVRRMLPRILVAACFAVLLLSQLGAVIDAPYIIDATNTVRDPKIEIIVILSFIFALVSVSVTGAITRTSVP